MWCSALWWSLPDFLRNVLAPSSESESKLRQQAECSVWPSKPGQHGCHVRIYPQVLWDGCFCTVWSRALLTARNVGAASVQACKPVRTGPAGWSHRKTQQTPYVDPLPAVEVPMEGPGSKWFKLVHNSADSYEEVCDPLEHLRQCLPYDSKEFLKFPLKTPSWCYYSGRAVSKETYIDEWLRSAVHCAAECWSLLTIVGARLPNTRQSL
jgi:hypothetical protein